MYYGSLTLETWCQGLLFRPPGQSSQAVQVAAKEEEQTSVELYYKLQDGHRGCELGEADADAAQQCHCVWAQDSSSQVPYQLVAGSEGGGHAPEKRGGKVQDTEVSGKTGAAGQSKEEDSLFEEVLVQLLVSRQGEVFSCCSLFLFPLVFLVRNASGHLPLFCLPRAIRYSFLTVSFLCLCGGQLQDLSSRDSLTC